MTTIEIKGLDDYPDLQDVILLVFTDFIKNEAGKDLTTPYLLVIDEAWKLFKTPSGIGFTEVEIVKSLRIQKGEYGEIFFMQGDNRSVIRITPDPLSYKICTGSAEVEF